MTPWQYARTQFGCILHYLRLAFWPSGLVLDYGTATADTAAQIVPYAVAVGVLVAGTGAALAWRPRWGFLGVWFWAILSPSSSIVPLVGQTEAERRMYLPLAAVVALVVLGAYAGMEALGRRSAKGNGTSPRRPVSWGRVLGAAMVLVVAAALGWATYQRNELYQSALAIWNDTARKAPWNSRARLSYGAAMIETDPHAALHELNKAIELDPIVAGAYNNRGLAYNTLGQYDAAIKDYGKAIELKPSYADAYNNRGYAYQSKGQYDTAIKDFDRAIELKPEIPEAYNNRGNAYNSKGQYDSALRDFNKAIEMNPHFASAYNNRAISHFLMKAYDRAWADLKMCRKLGGTPNPNFIEDLSKASGRSE
jgi:tetratricopeptide (TPR) repeat protein